MTDDTRSRPTRGVWAAWGLALLGGVAVLAAVGIALLDPCLQEGATQAADACAGSAVPTVVTVLAGGGTVVAVVGGLTATVLTLRRPRAEQRR